MNDEQFKAIKATMPWTERSIQVPGSRQIIVQIIDNRGQEVPLFTMTAFLTMITAKLARGVTENSNA
jgi:hypothetical protein